MSKSIKNLFLLSLIVVFLATISYCSKAHEFKMINKVYDTEDVISLFNITVDDIKRNTPDYIAQAKKIIDAIIAIPDEKRSFANTAKPLDEVVSLSNLAIVQRIYTVLELLSPSEAIRNTAHNASISIQSFWVDYVSTNKDLYHAFLSYSSRNDDLEELSAQQRYFVQDTIDSFKREGLSLPDETLDAVKVVRKELAFLTSDFDRNIALDKSFIKVKREDLLGLDDDFINTLNTSDDLYILGVDYPTYFRVMENCSVEETRKKLYVAFNNRAYPENEELLKTIIAKRDELARLLGYSDYTHCDIDSQMAHTPERAQKFIADITHKAFAKVKKEIEQLTSALPPSVQLSTQNKIKPWDIAFIQNMYKKTHFNVNEQKIAEYFPMEKTIAELLDIYRQFLSINFEEVSASGLWHEDVKIVRVLKDNNVIGTLLLDLYPRPNKYSHAGQTTIVPSCYRMDGSRIPNISIVMANFPKPTSTQPSLLKRTDVKTFFHEFGHALHAILGATEIVSLSGTNTKTDFVELPSQMLEEWLNDKDIIKKISSHYITHEPLPDTMIDTILTLKNFMGGYSVVRQAWLASIALSYFGEGTSKEPHSIMKELYTTYFPFMEFMDENHFYTSFVHLTSYGAKYYSYLWSLIFALDVFVTIKKQGLLNPKIGQKYINEVIGKGGAQDPNELLYNFLGREPNSEAFFEEMGL